MLTLKLDLFFIVIMSMPLSQLTIEQAHKKFNSLVDKFVAKYEQLDSWKFGAVGIPAFNDKSIELAVLPMPEQLHRLLFFKH